MNQVWVWEREKGYPKCWLQMLDTKTKARSSQRVNGTKPLLLFVDIAVAVTTTNHNTHATLFFENKYQSFKGFSVRRLNVDQATAAIAAAAECL
ncbi:hypothetical protein M0802_012642 [Mischocyttarus mexicanus]|nr:hypothetical protein M0802_012642 [Mischocyttarus mexicanus]